MVCAAHAGFSTVKFVNLFAELQKQLHFSEIKSENLSADKNKLVR